MLIMDNNCFDSFLREISHVGEDVALLFIREGKELSEGQRILLNSTSIVHITIPANGWDAVCMRQIDEHIVDVLWAAYPCMRVIFASPSPLATGLAYTDGRVNSIFGQRVFTLHTDDAIDWMML
jgi:hypothetical protein